MLLQTKTDRYDTQYSTALADNKPKGWPKKNWEVRVLTLWKNYSGKYFVTYESIHAYEGNSIEAIDNALAKEVFADLPHKHCSEVELYTPEELEAYKQYLVSKITQ